MERGIGQRGLSNSRIAVSPFRTPHTKSPLPSESIHGLQKTMAPSSRHTPVGHPLKAANEGRQAEGRWVRDKLFGAGKGGHKHPASNKDTVKKVANCLVDGQKAAATKPRPVGIGTQICRIYWHF